MSEWVTNMAVPSANVLRVVFSWMLGDLMCKVCREVDQGYYVGENLNVLGSGTEVLLLNCVTKCLSCGYDFRRL